MKLLPENFEFSEFRGYLVWDLVISISLIAIAFGIAYPFAGSMVKESQKRYKVYSEIYGKSTGDESALSTAILARKIHDTEPVDIEAIKNAKYSDILKSEWQEIDKAINSDPTHSLNDAGVITWKEYFAYWGIALYFLLNLLAAWGYGFALEGTKGNKSLIVYPWNRFWGYSCLPLLALLVIFTQPILLYKYLRWKRNGSPEEVIPEQEIRSAPQRAGIKKSPEDYFRAASDVAKDREAFLKIVEITKRNLSENLRAWQDAYKNGPLVHKQALEKSMAQKYSAMHDLSEKIENTQREMAEDKARLILVESAIQNQGGKTDDEAVKELHRILALEDVLACSVPDGVLFVYTDTIFIFHEDKKYEIGNFLIRIGMNLGGNTASYILIENLANTSTYKFHPYGFTSTNSLCFGKLASHVDKLWRNCEYYALIVIILQALKSAEGDKPNDVKYWKEVKVKLDPSKNLNHEEAANVGVS